MEDDTDALLIFSEKYDFSESDNGWLAGFSDYPAGPDDSTRYELKYAYTDQAAGSMLTKKSIMLSGNNLNRDLFMFVKKKVTGLGPNTDYTITFSVDLASTCSTLATATNGAVYLKAGAVSREPKKVIDGNYYVMNIDKGNEGTAGRDVISLGNIHTLGSNTGYALASRNNAVANSPYVATTNAEGELWIILGTDSNLEGTNSIFYKRVNIVFSPL